MKDKFNENLPLEAYEKADEYLNRNGDYQKIQQSKY